MTKITANRIRIILSVVFIFCASLSFSISSSAQHHSTDEQKGLYIQSGEWIKAFDLCAGECIRQIKNKQFDSDYIYSVYLLLDVAMAPSIDYTQMNYNDSSHPHLSYTDNLRMLSKWENVLSVLKKEFDQSLLDELKRFFLAKDNGIPLQPMDRLSLLSEISYRRLLLSVLGHNSADFEREWQYMNTYEFVLTDTDGDRSDAIYSILENVSETFAAINDYPTALHICSLIVSAYHEKRHDLAEKASTNAALLGCLMGDPDVILLNTFIALPDPSMTQTNSILYEDASEFIKQLVFRSRSELLRGNTKEWQEVLEYAAYCCEINMVCKNGLPISNYAKSVLYNELACSTEISEKKEIYLRKSIELDDNSIISWLNLARHYTSTGLRDNSETILLKIKTDEVLWNNLRLNDQAKIEYNSIMMDNAALKGDMASSAQFARNRLNHLKDYFLRSARVLTSSERLNFWAHSIGSMSSWFSTSNMKTQSDVAYDACLFEKGILANYQRNIGLNILRTEDSELKSKYSDYLNAIRDPNKSSICYERDYLYLYAKHNEFIDSFIIPSWKNIRSSLKEGEAAIEFFAFSKPGNEGRLCYSAMVLRHDYEKPHYVELCEEKEILDLWGSVKYGDYPKFYEIDELLNNISKIIWGKIQKELRGVKVIYYSPYRVLSQINMDILLDCPNGNRMNKLFSMRRLSSTGEICSAAKQAANNEILLIGGVNYTEETGHESSNGVYVMRGLSRDAGWDYLDWSYTETNAIEKKVPKNWKCIYRKGNDATEDYLYSISGSSPQIIHIATHGYYLSEKDARGWHFFDLYSNSRIPEDQRVGLVLANSNPSWLGVRPSGGSDGTLTASEIVGLDLSKTQLITLSACQTGLGEWYIDGTYGLQRALKIAGCNTLVLSLWKVSDEYTKLFMEYFYSGLFKGDERHDAFRKAQKKVQEANSSPQIWAAFIMLD